MLIGENFTRLLIKTKKLPSPRQKLPKFNVTKIAKKQKKAFKSWAQVNVTY